MASLTEKSKGLLEVGEHCAYCRTLSFLPFQCYDCGKSYCDEHKGPTEHGCEAASTRSRSLSPAIRSSPRPASPKSNRLGSTPGSRQTTPVPVTARSAPHTVPPKTEKKPPAALEKLMSLWGSRKPAGGNKPPNAGRNAAILALAELKRTAQGDSKIGPQDRVYIYLVRPELAYVDVLGKLATRPEKKLAVYLSKKEKVGRALDRASDLLAVSNKNNRSSDHRLGLYLNETLLPYQALLQDHVQNGATLVLR